MSNLHPLLSQPSPCLAWAKFAEILGTTENILIVQDLDGVCMKLVRDPLTRVIDPKYLEAASLFQGHFFVLTNGEHIGQRGVNGIVERALGDRAKLEGLYLPGLAAGGVQFQNPYGTVSHPGVEPAELSFLKNFSHRASIFLNQFLDSYVNYFTSICLEDILSYSILDNVASPTINLNSIYQYLTSVSDIYIQLQKLCESFCQDSLKQAASSGLSSSFFVHYAPNLGRDENGNELIRFGSEEGSGTTDFQFMLRGAVKEAGVLSLLNRYYFDNFGYYPLGEHFTSRDAPQSFDALLDLACTSFSSDKMPLLVGVGDTVTSFVDDSSNPPRVRRGGSDRGFLQLIQQLGLFSESGSIVAYVDSSGGELSNRKPVLLSSSGDFPCVLEGPGDPRDLEDPLTLDIIFPGGHSQYIDYFCQAATVRSGFYSG